MQLTLEGKTIDQLAIELIQAYEPPEGYYLGFSGGKDSVVIYDLAMRSGVKFEAHYSVSPIDPPQIHSFIRQQYPRVKWDILAPGFFSKLVLTHGLPTRLARWCCEYIKEKGGNGSTKILGMRRAESNKRSHYTCFNSERNQLLPIVGWQDSDVWQYISEHQLTVCSLYSEGFTRIGCVLCPFAGKDEIKLSLTKFPKIVNAWKQSADRHVKDRTNNPKRKPVTWKNGEEYFNWWIQR